MLPTPERIRSNRIASAGAAVVFAAAAGTATWFLAPAGADRIALPAAAGLLGLGAYVLGTRKWRRRRKVLARAFPPEWERILTERVAFYSVLDGEDKQRFHDLVRVFLSEARITGIEVELDDTCRLLVAASAVIPTFGMPGWEYSMLREVLVYPRRFDATDGLAGDRPPGVLGMVGNTGGAVNGLMVLAKPDLYRGFEVHGDRRNVGIHEFAHLVDKADGAIDGIPAGMPRECVEPWTELVRAELDTPGNGRRKRRGRSEIRKYGYTNEQEFLAVATEYFFESPKRLAEKRPEMYELLQRSFRQDARTRLANVAKRMFRPLSRKTGRNAPCPCGSGEKYKRCCLRRART